MRAALRGVDAKQPLLFGGTAVQRADVQADREGNRGVYLATTYVVDTGTPQGQEFARKYLAGEDARQLSCPGVNELCERAKDYRTLSEVARERGDSVHFLAGLLAANR